jgi:hypothetical protein
LFEVLDELTLAVIHQTPSSNFQINLTAIGQKKFKIKVEETLIEIDLWHKNSPVYGK